MSERFAAYLVKSDELDLPAAIDSMICLIQASCGEARIKFKNIFLSALYTGVMCDLSFLTMCVSNEFDIVVSFLRYLSYNEVDSSFKERLKSLVV